MFREDIKKDVETYWTKLSPSRKEKLFLKFLNSSEEELMLEIMDSQGITPELAEDYYDSIIWVIKHHMCGTLFEYEKG